MTAYRKPTTAEVQRAEAIVHMVTTCMAKYKDYRLALHDGYQIFTPDVPQDVYHFANLRNFQDAQSTLIIASKGFCLSFEAFDVLLVR